MKGFAAALMLVTFSCFAIPTPEEVNGARAANKGDCIKKAKDDCSQLCSDSDDRSCATDECEKKARDICASK